MARDRKIDEPEVTRAEGDAAPNAVWFKPVMFGLMIIGLLWIITFYISEGALPVRAWESWNIVAGFGIAIAGFLMTTRWRS